MVDYCVVTMILQASVAGSKYIYMHARREEDVTELYRRRMIHTRVCARRKERGKPRGGGLPRLLLKEAEQK